MVGIFSDYSPFKVCLRNGNEVTTYIFLTCSKYYQNALGKGKGEARTLVVVILE